MFTLKETLLIIGACAGVGIAAGLSTAYLSHWPLFGWLLAVIAGVVVGMIIGVLLVGKLSTGK